MNRAVVLNLLREHAPEFRSAGVAHLHLFGSVARDEAGETSDVDILAEFEPDCGKSLLNWGSLQWRLAELLETEVDLSSADWLKEPIRTKALAEAVLAF